MAADADDAVAGLDRQVERAEHRVVLQQVRHRLRVADVVRGHDLEVAAALELGAEEVPADPAEAVDPDPGLRHLRAPLVVVCASSLTAPVRDESVALRSLARALARAAGGPGSSEDDPPGPFTTLET